MFHKGNFDVAMLLEEWEETENDESLLHFSKFLSAVGMTMGGELKATHFFFDEQFSQQISQWLSSNKVKKVFKEKIEQTIMEPGEIFTASDLEELSWKYELIR